MSFGSELANIIRQLDGLAGKLFFEYNAWNTGWWERGAVRDFLAAHPPAPGA